MKDGKPLAEDARVAVNKDGGPNGSYEITIKKVQAGDAGTYSVVATNSFGKAECSAKIGCKGTIFQLQFLHIAFYLNNNVVRLCKFQCYLLSLFLARCQGCVCITQGT